MYTMAAELMVVPKDDAPDSAWIIHALNIPTNVIEMVTEREQRELARREQHYRDDRPPPDVQDCTVILIDDGLATGATMRAAARAVQQQHPAHIVVAVPVASPIVCEEFRTEVAEIVCARTPEPFYGVGYWYEDFSQTSDQEVHDLLKQAEQEKPVAARKH